MVYALCDGGTGERKPKFFKRECSRQDRNRGYTSFHWQGYQSRSKGRSLENYVPPAYRGLAVLVSNAGGESFDEFLSSYRMAFRTPLDELEELMLLRNALADKARDEMEDERIKPRGR